MELVNTFRLAFLLAWVGVRVPSLTGLPRLSSPIWGGYKVIIVFMIVILIMMMIMIMIMIIIATCNPAADWDMPLPAEDPRGLPTSSLRHLWSSCPLRWWCCWWWWWWWCGLPTSSLRHLLPYLTIFKRWKGSWMNETIAFIHMMIMIWLSWWPWWWKWSRQW